LVTSRSWFAVEGTLDSIDYPGPSFFRFPEAVAQHVIERYSRPGDWVLDPFCGFGTTLVVAERLGREPLGFETDARRTAFAASRIAHVQRVIHTRAQDVTAGPWSNCALLLTSPPYGSFRTGEHDDDPATYLADGRRLFSGLTQFLTADVTLAVEVSQVREDGRTRPLVWQLGV
jgi:23S rRNA G2445 N2-methylase RlmL